MEWLVNGVYLLVAVLFILGLKAMSSPVKARSGIAWAGVGMVLATLVTFLVPGMQNLALILVAIVLGGGVAWWAGRVVKMTDMPQMVAIYNGMGGGAAALIAAVEFARAEVHGPVVGTLAVLGSLIGSVAFSGSVVAFLKLQGVMKKAIRLPAQNLINIVLALLTIALGVVIVLSSMGTGSANPWLLVLFFVLSLALGAIVTMPIGGADMPVVISLLNAFTGLAVGFEGYVLGNPTLIIAGIVVGASGTLLTQLMAKAMNRPILGVLFTPISGEAQAGGAIEGSMKEMSATDAAALMRYSEKVIIIPGYGMAVAGAQHKVWEMAKLLEDAGVEVSFAIHPVAGRMPGHMNVLLAEAGVPYEKIFDLDEINAEFPQSDVALVIGANDVVNPVARTDKSSPIYGMPILDADKARNCIVIKRGRGAGYSGIENALFYADNTSMLYGSAQQAVGDVIGQLKELG
ncbi:NAD(P)(+) transhydrogenase (Re/Si-specific) subunit beta [Micropruina sonneratiae]|uniref:NAD(P)(+) transhydrogenase (Re/Si-specific) subunit beta n=1 Tax=Micropruina sonneratiae TaxID=2986940 RepID=UPI0022268860|nr:NAD(P)(+) transhydrogenase (Re/Si-specific) subunit beta [Micropruina sp. KQZ13P-5]MCW3157305.1 NAD(P)(+) transhydrogenase (Re/Si-specific) subunit beta [Micropruina sp. KQZ13P-5]